MAENKINKLSINNQSYNLAGAGIPEITLETSLDGLAPGFYIVKEGSLSAPLVIAFIGENEETVVAYSSGSIVALSDKTGKTITDLAAASVFDLLNISESRPGKEYGISMNQNPLTGLAEPEDPDDAATKQYVDTVVAQAGGIPILTGEELVTSLKPGYYIAQAEEFVIPIYIGAISEGEGQVALAGISQTRFISFTGNSSATIGDVLSDSCSVTFKISPTYTRKSAVFMLLSENNDVITNTPSSAYIYKKGENAALVSVFSTFSDNYAVNIITADGRLYDYFDVPGEKSIDDVMVPDNAFMAENPEDIVTKKFADQTYTAKTDYDTLNSKVQQLEETIATLQSTITQLQGNALTELDRQTLDVIERKS